MIRRAEPVMGTVVSVAVRGEVAPAALDGLFAWMHEVDLVYSPYRDDSVITALGRGAMAIGDAPAEVRGVLERCDALHDATGGYFDVHADPRWPLDPCGHVKGWATEVASQRLRDAGAPDHFINAGGDVRVRGAAPWRIGVAHPLVAGALAAVIELGDGAVATSGTYERGFHVFDPHRARPALDLASVTVVGDDLGTADAYATAALAMGDGAREWLESLAGCEALVIGAGGDVWSTPGFARLRALAA